MVIWRVWARLSEVLRAPRWLLPAASLICHFGSFGTLLPWPLVRQPLYRVVGIAQTSSFHLGVYLPIAQPLGGLSTIWLFYSAAPLILPADFPATLPGQRRLKGYARPVWIGLFVTATLLSIKLGGGFSHMPWACAGQQLRLDQCLDAARSRLGWSTVAFVRDGGECTLELTRIIGVTAFMPRRRVPLLSSAGAGTLGAFFLHTFLTPFTGEPCRCRV